MSRCETGTVSADGPSASDVRPGIGMLLVDSSFRVLSFNAEAGEILCFPTRLSDIQMPQEHLSRKVKSALLQSTCPNPKFVPEFASARRRYRCRVFTLEATHRNSQPAFALILERQTNNHKGAGHIARRFKLTSREQMVVELLMEGLTSKEIASRMDISTNTVKTFLRMVMVKMGVGTRSGIVAKVVETES